MIDVGAQDGSEDPKLFISEGKKSSYATLSYCWGGPQSVVLTTSTIDSLMQGIAISKLPQTIRDAISSTRKLGIQYLWVDALCIEQDSPSDKDLEIVKMKQYYENSLITIAAASAQKCSDGFLGLRSQGVHEIRSSSTIRFPCPDGLIGNITLLDLDLYDPRMEPLNTRGWAYQERALSPRLLTYGSRQLYWLCQSAINCDGGGRSWLNLLENNSIPPKILEEDRNKLSSIDQASLWENWANIVGEYTERNLTEPTDKLPALSGIAARFAAVSLDAYCAGLWKTHLLEGLAWKVLEPDGEVTDEYYAPTWSWVSSSNQISWLQNTKKDEDKICKATEVLECVVLPDNPIAPFGKVKDGSLRIKGVVKVIEWGGSSQIPMDGIDLGTLELSTKIGSPLYPEGIVALAEPDFSEETLYIQNLNVSASNDENDSWDEITFYMGRDYEPAVNSVTRPITCLVLYDNYALMLAEWDTGSYVRLGLMCFKSSAELQEYFHGCEENTVTIV